MAEVEAGIHNDIEEGSYDIRNIQRKKKIIHVEP